MRKGYEPRHFVIQNTLVFQVTADPLFHPFKGGHRLAQCQTPEQFAIKPGGGPGLPQAPYQFAIVFWGFAAPWTFPGASFFGAGKAAIVAADRSRIISGMPTASMTSPVSSLETAPTTE